MIRTILDRLSDAICRRARPPSEPAQIADLRARSNAAIAAHDAAAAAALLLDDAIVVASVGKVIFGRVAMEQAFARSFSDPGFTTYRRTPCRIEVGEGVAAEVGRWTAYRRDATRHGRYFARWQRSTDGWRIAAETYVPLARQHRKRGLLSILFRRPRHRHVN